MHEAQLDPMDTNAVEEATGLPYESRVRVVDEALVERMNDALLKSAVVSEGNLRDTHQKDVALQCKCLIGDLEKGQFRLSNA